MDTFSRTDAARRAGVAPAYVDRLVELGVVKLDDEGRISVGGTRRIMLLQSLEESGVRLDNLAQFGLAQNLDLDFIDAAGYDIFAPLTGRTFASVSAEEAIPVELLFAIREVMGGSPPSPDDPMREDELGTLPWITLLLSVGVSQVSIERTLRVYGDTARRAAETEAEWWRAEIEQRFLAEGRSVRGSSPTSPVTCPRQWPMPATRR